MTINPFHTNTPEYPPSHREVYHDKSNCQYAKDIKTEHRVDGKGGKNYCSECNKIS